MKTLKIALDWTPNVNHIGLLIAKELGIYEQYGIDLVIINPVTDNYQTTPGKKLELDIADFVLAPFETVISLNNKENAVDAIAVFAILQEDISSVASLKSTVLESPKALDGKTYASYKARYEDKIVKELVKTDGGKGIFNIVYPDKLGIWNTLLDGTADATWIFNNWEGVEAESKNIDLNKWSLKDYSIPYGYSPVIITKRNNLKNNKILYINFMEATRKGYLYAQENVSEVIEILNLYITSYDKENIDLEKALNATISYFGDHNKCGFMNPERVNSFLNWLIENNLENSIIRTQDLFTNELIKSI
ncbi:ABC-type nitrate/sulfonate/bicarbonate transport system, substrate-binding protein [Flavobacterium segetis]|uniref:Thiamine pyrimidine synthase n=1 Tax=Flavobacterium segetis TaxID=271157 RepID=A0A1M5FW89_9FLAO|nr:ABC transporter substrate-binding protein [Flavobacterium segetis]SHF95723.1 ABC-type nitrate/sulfonate/bicarbonate transport system, substrate-binding protein [Flavobacterium segetis]